MRITLIIILSLLASLFTYASVLMAVSNVVTSPVVTWTFQTLFSLPALPVLLTCIGTNILPALSKHHTGWKKLMVWLLWGICMVVTMNNYLLYFRNVSTEAGEFRAKDSVQVINSNQQIKTVEQALSHLTHRSVVEVTRDLSKTTNDKRIAVLKAELDEATRAEKLQDTLQVLQSNAVTIQAAESSGPVTLLLESPTPHNDAVVSNIIGMIKAFAFEMLAVYFWYALESLLWPKVKPEILVLTEMTEMPVPEVLDLSDDEMLAILRHEVEIGEIKVAVRAIRKRFNCSQTKAMFIRDAYLSLPNKSPVSMRKAKLDSIQPMQSEKSEIAAQMKKAA